MLKLLKVSIKIKNNGHQRGLSVKTIPQRKCSAAILSLKQTISKAKNKRTKTQNKLLILHYVNELNIVVKQMRIMAKAPFVSTFELRKQRKFCIYI